MFLGGPERPLPGEYRFLELESGSSAEPPADYAERVLVAVDCAKRGAGRAGAAVSRARAA